MVLLPALSSVWPQHAARVLGRPPWLPISFVDVCVLGCAAYTVLAGLRISIVKVQNLFARLFRCCSFFPTTTTTTTSSSSSIHKRFTTGVEIILYIVVIISSNVHPAMPALLGVVMLQMSCLYTTAAAITTEMPSSPQILSFKRSWLVTHTLASFPAGIWLFGWIASGRSHDYPIFSLEKVFMLVQGAHSCTIAFTTRPLATSLFRFIYEQFTAFVAVFVAFSGLWGSLHVIMPVMAILCSWELVVRLVQRKKKFQI